jgi:hypothetical protein
MAASTKEGKGTQPMMYESRQRQAPAVGAILPRGQFSEAASARQAAASPRVCDRDSVRRPSPWPRCHRNTHPGSSGNAQEAAADPLRSYCPDLDQWPASWAYEARDIPPGLRMVECFKPFLREMLALSLSRPTLRRHRDNIWALGGEVIRRLQMDDGLRRRSIKQVVLDLIGDDGGPLLSHGQSEAEQRSVDATCRKLFRFLTGPEISRGHIAPSFTATTNRSRH